MMSMGIDIFDYFSSLPMFKKMCRTDSNYMIKHMKSWFSLFGVRLMVRYDN